MGTLIFQPKPSILFIAHSVLARHSVCNHNERGQLIVVNVGSDHGKARTYCDSVAGGSEDQVGWAQTAGVHDQRVHPGDAGTRARQDGPAKPGTKTSHLGSSRKARQ